MDIQYQIISRQSNRNAYLEAHRCGQVIGHRRDPGIVLRFEGQSHILLVVSIEDGLAGIMQLQEADQREPRVFMFMLNIMLDQHRQLEGLIGLRRTEEVNRQQEYGGPTFHFRRKDRVFFWSANNVEQHQEQI